MTRDEKIELEIRLSLAQLRHMYWHTSKRCESLDVNEARWARHEGILRAEIVRLERLADSLARDQVVADIPSV